MRHLLEGLLVGILSTLLVLWVWSATAQELPTKPGVSGTTWVTDEGDVVVKFAVPKGHACETTDACLKVGSTLCQIAGHGKALSGSIENNRCVTPCELNDAVAFAACEAQPEGEPVWIPLTSSAASLIGGAGLTLWLDDDNEPAPIATPIEP